MDDLAKQALTIIQTKMKELTDDGHYKLLRSQFEGQLLMSRGYANFRLYVGDSTAVGDLMTYIKNLGFDVFFDQPTLIVDVTKDAPEGSLGSVYYRDYKNGEATGTPFFLKALKNAAFRAAKSDWKIGIPNPLVGHERLCDNEEACIQMTQELEQSGFIVTRTHRGMYIYPH
jgi:hypothetical protein